MFKQCEPQSWLSHCFQVVDLIGLELLVTVSRNSSAGTSRTWAVMALGTWGMSRMELLLHCNLKENEVNGALASSKTSAHLQLMHLNLCSTKAQE